MLKHIRHLRCCISFGLVAIISISNYCVSDSRHDLALGAAPNDVGPVSWDTVAAKVRKDGAVGAFRTKQWSGAGAKSVGNCVFRRVATGIDVLVCPGGVMLQKTKGVLDVVLEDKTAGYIDAAPDGRNIWISSQSQGVFLLDISGKLLGKANETNGLPKSDKPMQITALAPGLAIAIGSHTDSKDPQAANGWVAAISYDEKESAPVKVGIIASDEKLPVEWLPPDGARKWHVDPIRVLPMGNMADANEDPRAWVVVKGPQATRFSSILVNARTLESTLKLPHLMETSFDGPSPTRNAQQMRDQLSQQRTAPNAIKARATLEWIPISAERDSFYRGDDGKIYCIANLRLLAIPIGPTGVFANQYTSLGPMDDERGDIFIPIGDLLYIPGQRWYTFDPKTKSINTIGLGLQLDGHAVQEGASYTVSAHFGLCAFSLQDGCFHPMSIDAKKPMPKRPTWDGYKPNPTGAIAPPVIGH